MSPSSRWSVINSYAGAFAYSLLVSAALAFVDKWSVDRIYLGKAPPIDTLTVLHEFTTDANATVGFAGGQDGRVIAYARLVSGEVHEAQLIGPSTLKHDANSLLLELFIAVWLLSLLLSTILALEAEMQSSDPLEEVTIFGDGVLYTGMTMATHVAAAILAIFVSRSAVGLSVVCASIFASAVRSIAAGMTLPVMPGKLERVCKSPGFRKRIWRLT